MLEQRFAAELILHTGEEDMNLLMEDRVRLWMAKISSNRMHRKMLL